MTRPTVRFWDSAGTMPAIVEKCVASLRLQNPHHIVVLLTDDNTDKWVKEWPSEPFESVQKKSNWVRLNCLMLYGGVWMDASSFATSPVESWVDPDPSRVTVFCLRNNEDVYTNWAIGSPTPRHPIITEWVNRLRQAHARGPLNFVATAFDGRPGLKERWGTASLPYFWCHLALQCLLYDDPSLAAGLLVRRSRDGPLHRSDIHNTCGTGEVDSERHANHVYTAHDLATRPLRYEDR